MDVSRDLKSHLACTSCENFAIRCYLFNVPRPNEEVISCAPLVRTLLLDVTSSMSQGQMRKICRNFPLYTFLVILRAPLVRTLLFDVTSSMSQGQMKSHLMCTSCENFAIRCYLFNVPRPNEEDLQEFPLIYLSCHLACTSCENFAIRCYLFNVPRPNEKSSHVHLL